MCIIRPGQAGACDRYANDAGTLVRVDPHIVLQRAVAQGGPRGAVQCAGPDWDGSLTARCPMCS